MFSGNQCVAGVVTFPGEHNAPARFLEKSADRLRDAGACPVHERFNFYSSRESSFFRQSHLGRSQDWKVQLSLLIF
jgi:hypothetical protein